MDVGDPPGARSRVPETAPQQPCPPGSVLAVLRDASRPLAGRILRGSFGLLMQNVLSLLAMMYVSRALGAEGYGQFGLAIAFSVQAHQFMKWGCDPLMTRELVREPQNALRLLGAYLRQKQVASVIALFAGLLIAAWVGANGDARWPLVLLGVIDGLILGFSVVPAFDSKGRLATHVLLSHLRPLGFLVGSFALHRFAPTYFSTQTVLIVHALAFVPGILLEWRWTARAHGGRPETRGSGREAWLLWRAAAPLGLGETASQILAYGSVPAFTALAHASATMQGHLSASNQLAVAMTGFALITVAVLHVHLVSRRDPHGRRFLREILVLTGALVAICALLAVACGLLAPLIVPLVFGRAFEPAARIFALDAWRLLGTLGIGALSSALVCRGRIGLLAACQGVGLLAAVVLAWLFVPTHGAMAATAAGVVGRGAALLAAFVAVLATTRWSEP